MLPFLSIILLGSWSGNSFNYSPSSLESFTPNGQFSGGMVKSQSLTAFPQQPSANTPGNHFSVEWKCNAIETAKYFGIA